MESQIEMVSVKPVPEVEASAAREVMAQETDDEESQISDSVPPKALDWDAISAQNPDIYAWIVVPGTAIDYPVLSAKEGENPQFYLDHNLDGSYGPYPGCIFSEYTYNKTDFSDYNLVLYGHNMKDGSMFADLHKFEDAVFFEQNKKLYIYTPDKNYEYTIFAAYKTTDQHLFDRYNFSSLFGYMQYLDEILSQRGMDIHIDRTMLPTYEDKIITLSTCISGHKDQRLLVQGYMRSE